MVYHLSPSFSRKCRKTNIRTHPFCGFLTSLELRRIANKRRGIEDADLGILKMYSTCDILPCKVAGKLSLQGVQIELAPKATLLLSLHPLIVHYSRTYFHLHFIFAKKVHHTYPWFYVPSLRFTGGGHRKLMARQERQEPLRYDAAMATIGS